MRSFYLVVIGGLIALPAFARDCDYCVTCEHIGRYTCPHSGTFAICGEGGRLLCAHESGDNCSATFGKCSGVVAPSDALSVKKDGGNSVITMTKKSLDDLIEQIRRTSKDDKITKQPAQ
jgi:hypothetical protein